MRKATATEAVATWAVEVIIPAAEMTRGPTRPLAKLTCRSASAVGGNVSLGYAPAWGERIIRVRPREGERIIRVRPKGGNVSIGYGDRTIRGGNDY